MHVVIRSSTVIYCKNAASWLTNRGPENQSGELGVLFERIAGEHCVLQRFVKLGGRRGPSFLCFTALCGVGCPSDRLKPASEGPAATLGGVGEASVSSS